MPKTTKKESNQNEIKKTRGRPTKNIIGGTNKSSKGRGRPTKNIIKIKPKIIQKTKKTTIEKIDEGFHSHKIKTEKRKTSFALGLLVFSFLLFIFSLYKTFFHNNYIINNNLLVKEKIFKQKIQSNPNDNISIQNNLETEVIQIDPYKTNKIINITELEKIQTANSSKSGEILNTLEDKEENKEEDKEEIQNKEEENIEEKELFDIPEIKFNRSFYKQEESEEVEILQKILYNNGLYTGEITGIYDQNTINSIYKLQINNNLVNDKTPFSLRGYFGPGTRKIVNDIINNN